MWIKCAGSVLILCCAFLLGSYYGNRLTERMKQLRQLYQSMQLLKGEISYQHATLAEAFVQAGRRCEGCIGRWFMDLGERLNEKDAALFVEVWEPSLDKLFKETAFTKEDIALLREFGKNLGYLNLQMQENRILFFMDQLSTNMHQLEREIVERQRLYRTMSLLGGCFLIILLI